MVKPLGKRVLLKVCDTKQETASGLIITRETSNTKRGKVLAVGDVPNVAVGDTVLFVTNTGIVTDEGLILGEPDLLAVLE